MAMTNSSILGGTRAPRRSGGKDVDTLGPSDSSDSGSDSDSTGTGERGSATGRDAREGADIVPDRIDDVESLAADGDDPDEDDQPIE